MTVEKDVRDEKSFKNFQAQINNSKTLRIALKQCTREASCTTVFLQSLFDSMFCGGSTKLFENVHWSNVSKTDEFQLWTQTFVKASKVFRKSQIDAFGKLRPVLSRFLIKGGEISTEDLEGIEKKILKNTTEPKSVVQGLRDFADMVSFLENITDDEFHSRKIKRQLTNLQTRINSLELNE